MSNPMHSEIFEFYELNQVPGILKIKGQKSLNEKAEQVRRSIRKKVNELYNAQYPNQDWTELTEVERNDFILITVKDYILEKVKYPHPEDKKYKVDPKAQKIADKLNAKVNQKLQTMHRALKIMEEHNMDIALLYKQFFIEGATKEENHDSYLELCKHLSEIHPQLEAPSFEEWLKAPLTIYEIREEAILEYQRNQDHEDLFSYKPSKSEVLEEIISCLLKELNISIDVDGIKHCLTAASYIDTFDYENIENTPVNKDIIDSYIRLQEHNFIIKE